METYIQRLAAIDGIKDVDLHVEEVKGEDKTVDVVVDIFNQVNSGGTKLSLRWCGTARAETHVFDLAFPGAPSRFHGEG